MINTADMSALSELAPAGFYVALRVGFHYPMEEKNEFPAEWIARYTSRGLMLADPVMHWVYQNSGAKRWSDLQGTDPRNVLGQAAEFGMNFGAACCLVDSTASGQRSFGSFARSDREFTNDEVDSLFEIVESMHVLMVPPSNLTKAELEALRMVKNGLLMKEIANLLGVSEGAVKQRLKNAKAKLNAKTSTHAATMATSFGLI